jgi:hypothetical protein
VGTLSSTKLAWLPFRSVKPDPMNLRPLKLDPIRFFG